MLARVGKWIFWGCCALAILIAAWGIAGQFLPQPSFDPTDPFAGSDDAPPIFAFMAAAMVLGCGAAVRLMLAGLARLLRPKT